MPATKSTGKAHPIPADEEGVAVGSPFRLHLISLAGTGDVIPFTGDDGKVAGYYVTNGQGKKYLLSIPVAMRVDSALAMGADINVFGVDSEFHKLYVDDGADPVELPPEPVSLTPPSDEEVAAAAKQADADAKAEAKADAAQAKADAKDG